MPKIRRDDLRSQRDELYVNLFIPSVLQWGKVRVEQFTGFPYEEVTTLRLSCGRAKKEFTVKFRVPGGRTFPDGTDGERDGSTRVGIRRLWVSRKWADGTVRLTLPMSLRVAALPDGSDNYSFMYGPIVLASRMGKQEQVGLFADDSRGGHVASGPQWLCRICRSLGDKTTFYPISRRWKESRWSSNFVGCIPNVMKE